MRHCDVNKILNHRSPNLHFLDCSMSPKAEELFSVRSLPNSKLIKMHNIHEPDAPLPFTLPSKSHFINIMSEIGIHMGDICICYGQENFISASRMAFILSAYGNGESTYVLDGGLDACKEGNLPFVQGAQIGDYGIQDGYFGDQFTLNSSMFASFIQVKDVVVNGGDAIIDCRTSETFNAPPTSGRKYSFIPRAINLSSLMFIGENHKLKDIKEIEQILLDNGTNIYIYIYRY